VEGYPRGKFTNESADIVEKYIIEASNVYAFASECLPIMQVSGDGTLVTVVGGRKLPGLGSLCATEVDFEPFIKGKPCDPFNGYGNDSETYGQYVYATIKYSTADVQTPEGDDPDQLEPQDFLEVSAEAAGEFLLLPQQGKSRWLGLSVGEDLNFNAPVGKLIPMIEWRARWPIVPRDFLSEIISRCRPRLAKINNDAMGTIFQSPAVGTMLFSGWGFRQVYTWRTDEEHPPVEFEMRFLEKSVTGVDANAIVDGNVVTHNHFYRPSDGKWCPLILPTETRVYESADLAALYTGY
jgi:hypothetical protein